MVRALILAPFSEGPMATLRETIDVTHESWLETRRLWDPEELGARIGGDGISILVVEADFIFEELFDAATGLEFVGVCRAATNQVDIDAANRQGVVVVNTPGRNAQAVAEHALGLMLALARDIPRAHRYVAEGRWRDPTEPYRRMRGVELAGKTLGVIGLGAIGRRLSSIANGLGMTVIASDPYVDIGPADVELVGLEDLLSRADFASIHVPLTGETEDLLDTRRLGLLKATAFLVNTSDAATVDQAALVQILRECRIAGAAIDVFESHPVAPNNPLLELDNVVLSPHIGGATDETVDRHSQMMTDDILRWLSGQRPENLVNPEVWERRE